MAQPHKQGLLKSIWANPFVRGATVCALGVGVLFGEADNFISFPASGNKWIVGIDPTDLQNPGTKDAAINAGKVAVASAGVLVRKVAGSVGVQLPTAPPMPATPGGGAAAPPANTGPIATPEQLKEVATALQEKSKPQSGVLCPDPSQAGFQVRYSKSQFGYLCVKGSSAHVDTTTNPQTLAAEAVINPAFTGTPFGDLSRVEKFQTDNPECLATILPLKQFLEYEMRETNLIPVGAGGPSQIVFPNSMKPICGENQPTTPVLQPAR